MEKSAEQLLSAMADQKEELRKEITTLQAELEQYRTPDPRLEKIQKVIPAIIEHTKSSLKTCECALANDIQDKRLMKYRGECKKILLALAESNPEQEDKKKWPK